ncbi:MAG: Rieske 2Fe-2S domain-containing protein [Alphaproteobacteria bacterium]|nr:Rieske 2Fe-2S domain-containing protein [Alphaproteobacteria bacterium]
MVAVVRVTEDVWTPALKSEEPELGSALIPKERYTSRDFMQREWERMWTKVWLVGCREEEIPEAGDYITTEIGPESLLIVRGDDGVARTFYNVCNHRGNQVKFDQCGNARTLQCAYHFWEYDLTGRLINVPDEEDFAQGCPRDRLSLKAVETDTWGGWVWFNLDPDAGPLEDYLGIIPQHLDAYHLDRMAMTQNMTVEWDCNWKTSVDAFNEVYHVQCIHPELLYNNDDVNVQIDLYDRHNRYLVPYQTHSPRLGEVEEVPEIVVDYMRSIGMDHEPWQGRVPELRRAISAFKRENQERLGIDYSDLNDDQVVDDYHYFIFPNITLNIFAEWALFFRQRPHESDPNKMYYDVQFYNVVPKGQPRPPLPDHDHFKHGEKSLGLVLDQDSVNLPHVQKGMNSSAFEGLWISHQERRIRHMHKTLMEYVGE